MTTFKIRERERSAILQALRAGVVPRTGLPHLQVGRTRELEELIKDIDRIGEGGAAIRFIIGEYGAGKTFFINLIRQIALEKGLVALSADVTPDRRLHATGGQARSLYAEMTKNAATRSRARGRRHNKYSRKVRNRSDQKRRNYRTGSKRRHTRKTVPPRRTHWRLRLRQSNSAILGGAQLGQRRRQGRRSEMAQR